MRDDDKKRRSKPKKARMGSSAIPFVSCVMGVPTCCVLLPGLSSPDLMAAVQVGVLLGVAYLLLRPILKLLTLPLGCLTLGLFNFALDVGLLYGCAYFVAGFSIEQFLSAVGCALFINAIAAVAGGFR